jgi:hypothetical protein
MSDSHPTPDQQFNPGAAILAWLWPGLGHMSLGHRKRGGLIMLGVLFLFMTGILVGGIDVVDRKHDHLWFLAQSVCGPITFLTDYINQTWLKTLPEPQRWETISLNKPNELGTLFVALAGLMNLVVILDAMFFIPKPLPETPPSPQKERRANP